MYTCAIASTHRTVSWPRPIMLLKSAIMLLKIMPLCRIMPLHTNLHTIHTNLHTTHTNLHTMHTNLHTSRYYAYRSTYVSNHTQKASGGLSVHPYLAPILSLLATPHREGMCASPCTPPISAVSPFFVCVASSSYELSSQ